VSVISFSLSFKRGTGKTDGEYRDRSLCRTGDKYPRHIIYGRKLGRDSKSAPFDDVQSTDVTYEPREKVEDKKSLTKSKEH